MARPPLRILFCCTGVGILNRGIESFFREAFDNLPRPRACRRGWSRAAVRRPSWNGSCAASPVPRAIAAIIGQATRRNAYVAEQWSSFLPVVREIRQFRPEVVFYSDANLGFLLYWFRRWIGVRYRLLFSNGAVPATLRQAGLRAPGQSGPARGGAARGRTRRQAHHGALWRRSAHRQVTSMMLPGGRCASAWVCPPISRWC